MTNSREIYSVKALAGELRNLLESSYRNIWVEGEISGLAAPASGHLYFSLKEESAIIRCAFFRNRRLRGAATPKNGDQVIVRGQISVYESRGDLQLIVTHIEPAGEGLLRRAFEALKNRLSAEGLFKDSHKKALPKFPSAIGLITSDTGAALHDMRVTLNRRYPQAHVIIYPTLVQGAGASEAICHALAIAAERNETDVVILARGGGSLEDLQAFNQENVARAIFDFPMPIVSGVGHETDITIADFVADHRAATPTAAAALVTPNIDEIKQDLANSYRRLQQQIERTLNQHKQHIDYATAKLVHPTQRLESYRHQHQLLSASLVNAIRQQLRQTQYQIERQKDNIKHYSPAQKLTGYQSRTNQSQRTIIQQTKFGLSTQRLKIKHLTNALQLMSPAHTLNRGYAVLTDQATGKVISSTKQVKSNQSLRAKIADGTIDVTAD